MRSLLPLAATLCAATLLAQSPLTTGFAGGNGQAGNMFDLEALNPAGITVRYFEVNLDPGTWNMEIYKLTVPGPYLPSVSIAANWTSIGTATGIVSNGGNVPTICPIPVCEYIPANTIQSFYVTVTNGAAINYTNGTATGAIGASNPDLVFYQGAGVAYPFASNFNPRVFNGNIYYGVGPDPNCSTSLNFASKSSYGVSCYNDPRMVHEFWTPNSAIDLVNTSWIMTFNPSTLGGNYTISAGGLPYDASTPSVSGIDLLSQAFSTSSSTGTWDDASINLTLDPLAFPTGFPYPNGASATATEISVNSNGRIYLGSHLDVGFSSNGCNSLQALQIFQGTLGVGLPVVAAFMSDLDPTVGGNIWYEASSPNGGVRITWDNVMNWQDPAVGAPLAVANSFQMELLPNGIIFLSYGASLGNGGSIDNEGIAGFSPGAGEPLNAPIDWSAITSLNSGTGPGITLDADFRPVLGSTVNLTVDLIPAGTLVAGVIFGLTKIDPGLPLFPIVGVPCNLHATLDLVVTGVLPGASYTAPLPIPVSPALSGVSIACQGLVAFNLAYANPLNATLSNGVELLLGN